MFDSNDLVWLIQRLNGVEARIFISFAPVSNRRDLEFLRWLGVDIPRDLDRFLLGSEQGEAAPAETCLERSINLAQRILMDVFDNLPPDPPPIGLNIEHITRKNFAPALAMLDRLGNLYAEPGGSAGAELTIVDFRLNGAAPASIGICQDKSRLDLGRRESDTPIVESTIVQSKIVRRMPSWIANPLRQNPLLAPRGRTWWTSP